MGWPDIVSAMGNPAVNHYRECDDPDCPAGFAFRSPFPEAPHWHFIGSPHHPIITSDVPSCLLCGKLGSILCQDHR